MPEFGKPRFSGRGGVTCAQAQRMIREAPEYLALRRRLLLQLHQDRDWPAVGFFTSCPLHAPGCFTDEFVERWAIDRVMIGTVQVYCGVICSDNVHGLAALAESVAAHIPGEMTVIREFGEWTEEARAHVLQ